MYNEVECVEELLSAFISYRNEKEKFEILAIDNGSSDQTAVKLKANGMIFKKR